MVGLRSRMLIDRRMPVRSPVNILVAQKCLLSIIIVISSEGFSGRSQREDSVTLFCWNFKKTLAFLCM